MSQYTRTTLGDLVSRLTERVGNNAVFWTAPEKRNAVNEAILVWNALTGAWNRTFQLPTTGDIFYNTPRQILSLQRVKWGTSNLELSSLFELDNWITNWQSGTGTPTRWVPLSHNMFAVYPAPVAGAFLNLEGIARVPRLGNDAEFLDMGDEEVGRVLDYAHFYLAFKEGGEELKSAANLLLAFVESAVLRNQRLNAVGYFRKFLGLARDETQRAARADGGKAAGSRGPRS